ncbi:thioredoxin-related transmembrane protein 4 [Pristis pectinata]|uniref:thioredoxin-related transmembrane protein 4 n=1 Tax=Pristis pectinata TaxID=685728 RepID=UPI00223E49E1|nr:thioredoxin-related transmembrane protein 4 [Pristis pectinata]
MAGRTMQASWILSLCLVLAQSARCMAEPGSRAGVTAAPAVESLGDTNWTLILTGEWMLQFHAPWCPACKQIQADWEDLGKSCGELGIHVGKIDVTREPGLSGRFFVTTLPTIYHAKEGVFRKYHGARMLEDFQSFIKEKKWEAVESISGWKSPSSIVMSGMAGLFRLSVWIRQMHNYLTETLGIPVWGSYIIFAVATLMTGLILGLILVLIADCICPQKRQRKLELAEVIEGENGENEADEEDSDEGEKKAQDAPEWQANGSEAEAEGDGLSDKACGDESPFEDDLENSEHEDELEAPPSSCEVDGVVRKRILKDDS